MWHKSIQQEMFADGHVTGLGEYSRVARLGKIDIQPDLGILIYNWIREYLYITGLGNIYIYNRIYIPQLASESEVVARSTGHPHPLL